MPVERDKSYDRIQTTFDLQGGMDDTKIDDVENIFIMCISFLKRLQAGGYPASNLNMNIRIHNNLKQPTPVRKTAVKRER